MGAHSQMIFTCLLSFIFTVHMIAGTPHSQDAQCPEPVMPLPQEQMLLQRYGHVAHLSKGESSGAQCRKWCKPNVEKGKFTWGQLCFRPIANKTCGGCTECADAEEPLCGVGTFIEFGAETTCEACPTGRFTAVPGVTKCKRCKGKVSDDAASCIKKGGIKKKDSAKARKGRKPEPKGVADGDFAESVEGSATPPPPESNAPPSGPSKDIPDMDGPSKPQPGGTKGKAPTKPECVDTEGTADSYGTTCAGYAENPDFCAYPGDDEDFTATEMCCACGKEQQKEWLEDREENDFVVDESLK